jgi:DNA polymerase III delta prime subunit
MQDGPRVTYTDQGSFVTVSIIDHINLKKNLSEGNFSGILNQKIIFKSKVFKEIQKQLEAKDKDHCLVLQGFPGIGKSTSCWALCCMKLCSDSASDFIFVYFYQNSFRGVVHLKDGKISATASLRLTVQPTMDAIISSLHSKFPNAQLVLDGVNQSHASGLVVNPFGWITVASVGLDFKQDAFDFGKGILVRTELDSWTLEEFRKAVEKVVLDVDVLKFDKEFLGIETEEEMSGMEKGDTLQKNFKEAWVNERYFISGGSARLMFGGNIIKARSEIEDALTCVKNLNDLFGNITGHRSQGDISRLRQRIENKYTFLSPYVIRALSTLADNKKSTLDWDTFVSSAKKVAVDIENDAFKGWVHEFDFLVKLYPARALMPHKKLTLKLSPVLDRSACRTVELQVDHVVRFWKETDLASLSLQDKNILAWPQSFKQGTYDAAFVCFNDDETPVIITMQATVSRTHSFKPQYITKLINQLTGHQATNRGSFRLWHIFVLEGADQFDNFSYGGPKEVGIRETKQNKERAWAMKPVFWKTNLNA